jgi:hypothetical protein
MNHLFSILIKQNQYLDPGSGSMIIQMVIAAVLGVGVAIRVFWKNIKGFFNRNKHSEIELDPTAIVETDETETSEEN